MIPVSLNYLSNFCWLQDLLKSKDLSVLIFLSPFPTSWSSFGIRSNYPKDKKIILTESYAIVF